MVYVAQLLGLELNIAYLENVMMAQFYQESISQIRWYQKKSSVHSISLAS